MKPLEYITEKIENVFQLLHLEVTELGYEWGEKIYREYQTKVPGPNIRYLKR